MTPMVIALRRWCWWALALRSWCGVPQLPLDSDAGAWPSLRRVDRFLDYAIETAWRSALVHSAQNRSRSSRPLWSADLKLILIHRYC